MAKIQLTLFATPATASSRGETAIDQHSLEPINEQAEGLFSISSKSTYDLRQSRDSSARSIAIDCDSEQIVELELADGGMLYLRLDELQLLTDQQSGKPLQLSSSSMLGGVAENTVPRSFSADFIKSISLLEIDWSGLLKLGADSENVEPVAKHFLARLQTEKDALLHWNHRLKQWKPKAEPNRVIPKNEQPLLIFIHGTASSTLNSFSDLWLDSDGRQRQVWLDFVDTYYHDRVYALEHDTLTQSPARNAINLLKALSKGQKIHLVSHSRGGLVGELICLSGIENTENTNSSKRENEIVEPISKIDIERFSSAYDEAVPAALINDLKQLNKHLKDKSPVVERFVRVACPARGTTLASGRLDIYLSALATTAQLLVRLTNPQFAQKVDVLKSFAMVAAKKRMRLSELPGLESMIPDRGFIRLLNDHASKVTSSLTVIAGNSQADGFSRQTLLVALSNSYYWSQNDFVVETGSMQGGLRRSKGVSYLLDKNTDVNHFSYFKNEKTVRWIYDALKGIQFDNKISASEDMGSRRGRTAKTNKSPPVIPVKATGTTIIIPGFAGTHLLAGGERVWIKTDSIAAGKLDQLDLQTTPQAETDGWVESRYQGFANYLEANHYQNIVSFRYDWRLSTQQNADLFTEYVQRILSYDEYKPLPVRIVAHSTGGYIALKALHDSAALRRLLVNTHDMELFLAGMPFNGTFHALEIIHGVSTLLPYLSLIDRENNLQTLSDLFASFPGLIDMLPAGMKNANKTLHQQLANLPKYKPAYSSRIHYIAGAYSRTPIAMKSPEEFVTDVAGDGSARWDEIPAWITQDRVWYMGGTDRRFKAMHGNLLAIPTTFSALAELIINGDTHQLSHTRPIPSSSRSLKHAKLDPDKLSLLYPNKTDIENTALRASTIVEENESGEKLYSAHIRIVNGDLKCINHPIVVGHYLQDGIKSAEAIIDNALDGWLSDLHRKNLYPGELETVEVVTQRGLEVNAFGAVVVGLGAIGSLTVRKLRATLKEGFIKYGLYQRELRNNCTSTHTNKPNPIVLSSLLIGAGSGGIGIDDSVQALLRSLTEANRVLVDMHCEPIARLDIVELFEDVAITAARSLQKIKQQFTGELSIEPLIVHIDGAQNRATSAADDSWWRHVQVLATDTGSITFSPLTSRAGMDTTVLDTQAQLIDTLIKQSTHETRFNRHFSQTLFKLLIPNGLKEQVMDDNGMVLLLNKHAAVYPWEMLVPADRGNTRRAPFATEIGLIRKLHTEVDNTRPAVINHKAMIVGDPISSLPELPGAQQEAKLVRQLLQDSVFDVGNNVLIKSSGVDIVSRVMNTEVQILHLAGHGIYIPPGDSYAGKTYENGLAGMVLGNGIFLTEQEVQQLASIPELIFINCCHLGKIVSTADNETKEFKASRSFLMDSRSTLAANLGTAFIEAGAKCVVAAGWEVDDAAALEFASRFYEHFIHHGDTFGMACKRARIEVFKKYPRTNTWGAYQCYGDPLFRFENTSCRSEHHKQVNYDVFHSPRELVIWSNNICARPELSKDQQKRIIKETRARAENLPDAWNNEARVYEAIANLFAKTDEVMDALKWYGKASQCENSALTLKALERKVQLLIRLSEEMHMFYSQFTTMSSFDEQYIQLAITHIKNLLELGQNKERLTLKAQVYRHYALVKMESSLKTGRQHMQTAYDIYSAQSKETLEKQGKYDAPALLAAVSIWLGLGTNRTGKNKRLTTLKRYLSELKQLQKQLDASHRKQTFHKRENSLRCKLLIRLLTLHRASLENPQKGDLYLEYDDLQRLYLRLLDQESKKNQRLALNHIRFLYTYLGYTWNKKSQKTVEGVKALHDQLDLICNT